MLSALALFASSLRYNYNYMGLQWCLGLSVMCLFIGYQIFVKSKSLLPALAFTYLAINSVYTFGFVNDKYPQNPELAPMLALGSVFALLSLLLISIATYSMDKNDDGITRMLMIPFGVINAIWVCAGQLKDSIAYLSLIGSKYYGPLRTVYDHLIDIKFIGRLSGGVGISGFIDYAGMNAVMMCLSIPFALKIVDKQLRLVSLGLLISAIIASKSSIPYGVLAIMLLGYAMADRKISIKTVGFAVSPMLVAACAEGKRLFDSAHRFDAYKLFFTAWKQNSSWLIGSGPGTFQSLAPVVQIRNNFMVDVDERHSSYFWLWAHSDWFQCLLENGIIGLTLCVTLFAVVLYRLYKKQDAQMFSLACGLGAAAIFDFPVRYFSMAFITAWVVASAYL